jgi:DNA-directed RNA polymerase subunit beta
VNDLDRGPYISNTLRIDATVTRLEALVEIYRMMRPGRAADQGRGREPVPEPVLQPRALRPLGVGRMKFNRRVGRTEITGPGVRRAFATKDDIIDTLRTISMERS